MQGVWPKGGGGGLVGCPVTEKGVGLKKGVWL